MGGGSLERVTGIEPASRAWEARVLPLNYTRKKYLLCTTSVRCCHFRTVFAGPFETIREFSPDLR